jgi:hypothetical protein
LKKTYETKKKKKTEVIGVPPSNYPWFDCFDNIFFGTTKINGIPNTIDQGVCVMNFEIEVVNVSDEKDVQTLQMPRSLERQTPVFRDDNANFGTTPSSNSYSPRTRACKLPSVQGKANKKLERKKGNCAQVHLQLHMPLIISDMW